MSQKDLGDAIGYDQSTIAHWESGRNLLTVDMAEKVADALRMPPGSLAYGDAGMGHCRVKWRSDPDGEVYPITDGDVVPMPPGSGRMEGIAMTANRDAPAILFVSDTGETPVAAINAGWRVLVETAQGRCLLGQLYFGERRGTFSIHRQAGDPVLNVEITRVRAVRWGIFSPALAI